MMSYTNSVCYSNIVPPSVGYNVPNRRNLLSLSRGSLRFSCLTNFPLCISHQQNMCPWVVSNVPKNRRFSPAHVFSEEGKSENEFYSWESLKKDMTKKGPSVEGFLMEALKRGLGGNGGGRNSRRFGCGDNSGDQEDGGLAETLEEIQQVILAFLGVFFLYIFMIRGQEIWRLSRDYIKYLFGGRPSVRLSRTMESWQKFFDSIAWKK